MGGATLLLVLSRPQGGGVVTPLPANFAQALIAWWADQGFDVSIGPLTQVKAAASAQTPTNTFKIARGSPFLLTSTSSIYDYRLTISIRDLKSVNAHANAALVADAFDGVSLEWDGGWSSKPTQQGWISDSEMKPSPSATNQPAYVDTLDYAVRIWGIR